MNDDVKKNNFYHERANHESQIHLSRSSLFISFNGFFAIALSLVDEDNMIKIIFAVLSLFVNLFWLLWAPNARKYIRALRDAGKNREDERLWIGFIRTSETKYRGLKDPHIIIGNYIPKVLFAGWILILIYLIIKL